MEEQAKASPATSGPDNRIFEILRPPPRERVQMLREGWDIKAGDFGWSSPWYPRDKEGMVHLTGYDENYTTIWSADLETSEVRYVGPKPQFSVPNPFPTRRSL
jgi:hypothetical protein